MPTVRRIIVGVHGSLGSLQALRFAADEARQRNVPLLAVTAWVPPGGDMAERRHPSPYLRKLWREAAWERLWTAFDAGLGGLPADLQVETPGGPRRDRPGAGRRRQPAGRPAHHRDGPASGVRPDDATSVSRYCLAHARCPVLAVPPSALMDEMSHPLHSWHVRRHELIPDTPDMLAAQRAGRMGSVRNLRGGRMGHARALLPGDS